MDTINKTTGAIIDCAYHIHRQFGPGLLESVYEKMLASALRSRGHTVVVQQAVSFTYEGVVYEDAFRVDLLVDGQVVVELKSTEVMQPVYAKQLLSYIKLMSIPIGLLINFGQNRLTDGVTRLINTPVPGSTPTQHCRSGASQ